jgi:hemerythrin-like domain-containing protein
MESFNQVKDSFLKAAKDAKEIVVDVAQAAQELARDNMSDSGTDPRPTGANARPGGVGARPDALTILTNDHEMIDGLFQQLNATLISGESVQSSDGIFAQLAYEIDAHTRAEEQQFYPALAQAVSHDPELRAQLQRSRADHERFRRLLAEMENLPTQSPEWRARLNTLEDEVSRHVQFEENDLFRLASQAFDQRELQQLGDRIDQVERQTEQQAGRQSRRQPGQQNERPSNAQARPSSQRRTRRTRAGSSGRGSVGQSRRRAAP